MKSIMLSVKPEWVSKILNGEKTIEIRKTKPSCELPIKVYIYQTKSKGRLIEVVKKGDILYDSEIYTENKPLFVKTFDKYHFDKGNGKVVAEFTLKEIDRYTAEFVDNDCYEDIRLYTENPYAEDIGDMYWEDIITTNEKDDPSDCDLCKQSCVSYEEIKKYIGVNWHDIPFYGWHIDDLKVYDKPKELGEFCKPISSEDCEDCYHSDCGLICSQCKKMRMLTRPPQSWCYVEELEEV